MKCTAHTRSGKACGHYAIHGGNVCTTHGGRAPQVQIAAQRNHAMTTAREAVMKLIGDREPEPIDARWALTRMVYVAAMVERFYAGLVSELESPVQTVDYGKAGGIREEPHALVKLWNEERDRVVKVSKTALDAGIEERQVQAVEELSKTAVSVILTVLTAPELGLTQDQQSRAKLLVATKFRALPEAS